LDFGGAEAMLCKLVSDQTNQSLFRHHVISLAGQGKIEEILHQHHIPVFHLGMQKQPGDLIGMVRLAKLFQSIQPQIIQTWLYHADLLGLIVGRLFSSAKIVWNIRCSDMDLDHYGKTTKLIFFILAKLSVLPQAMIFNSEAGRAFHLHSGYAADRGIIIPNGFDLSLFKPDDRVRNDLRNRLEISKATPVVGIVARFDPMKDYENFFQAANIIKKRNAEVKFILVGKGMDRENPQVQWWIKKNGLENNVYLLGEQKELNNIYPAFDIFTLCSAYGEGFPNVLGEAMACGIPCVATDVGDSRLIIEDAGVIVPPRDPETLARAWESLLNLPDENREALGNQARRRIKSNFSLPIIRNRYHRFYARLLDIPVWPTTQP
jgi:glycosyltransferase involved in cell wall biosynthesis